MWEWNQGKGKFGKKRSSSASFRLSSNHLITRRDSGPRTEKRARRGDKLQREWRQRKMFAPFCSWKNIHVVLSLQFSWPHLVQWPCFQDTVCSSSSVPKDLFLSSFLIFFWYDIQQCPGLNPDSVLSDFSGGAQRSLLVVLRDHFGCWGLNLGWLVKDSGPWILGISTFFPLPGQAGL